MRPALLQLPKQGESDNFLEAFPLIDMYLHVILGPMCTSCVPDMKHGCVMRAKPRIAVWGKCRYFIGFRHEFIVEYFTV